MSSFTYKNDLAKRVNILSLKIERIAKKNKRTKEIDALKEYATLQKSLEQHVDEIYNLIALFEKKIKKGETE